MKILIGETFYVVYYRWCAQAHRKVCASCVSPGLFSADSCQGRIIITSQDLPKQVEDAANRYQNFLHCQPLIGLEEKERLELFEKTGLEIDTDSPNKAYLERIGTAYEGHPLALRVIAGEIGSRPFYGNVVAYWNRHGSEIEEVEKAIEEAETKGITASADDKYSSRSIG